MWYMDTDANSIGQMRTINMPTHFEFRASIDIAIGLGQYVELGLDAQLTVSMGGNQAQCLPFIISRLSVSHEMMNGPTPEPPPSYLQFGLNLDTKGNGFGGSDFGMLMDLVVSPTIIVKDGSGTNRFQIGGPGGGLTGTLNVYTVSGGGW